MADAITISNAIKEIKAAYPRFEASPDTIKVWAVYLADLPNGLLMAAIRKFISSATHAFPPSIPEIRQMATQIKLEIEDIPTAFEAWEDLLRAGNGLKYETGYNPDGSIWLEKHPYKFRHPLVEEVARRFGWPERFPNGDDDMADRAHFFKAYESALGKASRAETQLSSVTAYIESEKSFREELGAPKEVKQLSARLSTK